LYTVIVITSDSTIITPIIYCAVKVSWKINVSPRKAYARLV